MTERERLVELITEAHEYWLKYVDDCAFNQEPLAFTFEQMFADHLLANGVIVPPCKVGDACYPLWNSRSKPIVERKISRITYSARNIIIGYYENDGQYRPPLRTRILDVDVFLSREDAEKALKERSEGK
jgi:hypothetical protein